MAVYDPEQQKVIVRIVYDGPARAGKTTNLRQLADCFTLRRRSEVYVPEEMDGRTLFFDWMQVDGGLVAGAALRCQFLTVPGQRGLAARRKRILQTADVVVFVCSSARRAQGATREMLETLRWSLRSAGRRDTPIVVQANKQDLKTALSADELREALGLPPEVAVVAAKAAQGTGVRETAALAMRVGAGAAEKLILERGLDALAGREESATQLLARLQEMGRVTLSSQEIVGELAQEEEDETHPGDRARVEAPRAPEPIPDRASTPPRPRSDVPTGCVWPSTSGRQVLHALGDDAWQRRVLLPALRGESDDAESGTLSFRVGSFLLQTSRRRRYDNLDQARDALLAVARRTIQLGELLAPQLVVSAQQDDEGRAWLWTIVPWMPTLQTEIQVAAEARDVRALGVALAKLARALVAALVAALRRGVTLDLRPSHFCSVDAATFYVGGEIGAGDALPSIGSALLEPLAELAEHADALAVYLSTFTEELVRQLQPAQIEKLAVIESLQSASVNHPVVERARERLLGELCKRVRGR